MARPGRVQRYQRWHSDTLHAVARSMRRRFWEQGDFTPRMEWAFDHIIRELEYRHRRFRTFGMRLCMCELCCGPFCLRHNGGDQTRSDRVVYRTTCRRLLGRIPTDEP